MDKEFLKQGVFYGLIMAGIFIILDLLSYTFGMISWGLLFGFVILLVVLAIFFITFIWGGRSYRDKFLGGKMKYGKALLFCLLIASVFAISMFVYNILFYFIFDTSRAMNDAKTIADMIQNNPNIPDKNKEEALLDVEKVTNLKTVLKNLSSNLIMGIVFGAISALFIRKKEKFTEVF